VIQADRQSQGEWGDTEIAFLTERSGLGGLPGSRANTRSSTWPQGGLHRAGGYRRGSSWTDGQFSATRAKAGRSGGREPGTLVYEWSFHPDQKTYNLMEVYQNSDALAAHAKHVAAADFLKELGQVRKITNAIVFGSPDAQVKEALARLDPVYTSHSDGFMR
jgi:quinol monooxygenase YgiN